LIFKPFDLNASHLFVLCSVEFSGIIIVSMHLSCKCRFRLRTSVILWSLFSHGNPLHLVNCSLHYSPPLQHLSCSMIDHGACIWQLPFTTKFSESCEPLLNYGIKFSPSFTDHHVVQRRY
jgi:hypothetical protein